MKYLIWSFEHNAWWRPNKMGYTENIDEAGRYVGDDAGRIVVDSVLCQELAVWETMAKTQGPPKYDPWKGEIT